MGLFGNSKSREQKQAQKEEKRRAQAGQQKGSAKPAGSVSPLREKEPAKASAPPPQSKQKASAWTPTNSRLSSNMPLSSLCRVFIFTSGNGKTVLSCPVAMGTLADTAGAPPNEVQGKVKFDIIAGTNVGKTVIQSGQFPDSAWTAMSHIAPDESAKAQLGLYRTTIRPFENPNTRESGMCVLFYQK